MLLLSQVNCWPGSMLSYSAVNLLAPSSLSSSMWVLRAVTGMGGWESIPGVWKFIRRSSTGSEGAITEALAMSKPDMSGVVTWPPSMGCFNGCRFRLNTITKTTRRARPIPATTGPTTQPRLAPRAGLGMRLQSMPEHSPGVAGGRVALGVYGSEEREHCYSFTN